MRPENGTFGKECFGKPYWNDEFRQFLPFLKQQATDKQAVETVEEAYIRMDFDKDNYFDKDAISYDAFIKGSEWQQSQSYSREEVVNIVEAVLKRVESKYPYRSENILTTQFKDLLKK